jgi:hypothetical protein
MDFNNEFDIKKDDKVDLILSKVLAKLQLSEIDMKNKMSQYCADNAEKIIEKCLNIAPYDDYGRFMESMPEMIKFVKEESGKEQNWKLHSIIEHKNKDWLEFVYNNISIDDGKPLKGHIYVDLKGNIKHAFAQYFA